jgi:hypothetical protein
MLAPDSVTGRFLAQPLRHPLQPRRAVEPQDRLRSSSKALRCTT